MGDNSVHIEMDVYICSFLTKESMKISNGRRF